MESDAELVSRWRDGDRPSLEMLLRRYESDIYGYLVRLLGNRHDAEDAAQNAFVNAVRSLPRYRERGTFKSWLFRIAHREGGRILRRRRRSRESVGLHGPAAEAAMPVDRTTPDSNAMSHEDAVRVRAALERLPAREREVVVLRTYTGLTFREIAAITACPINTALARMHRATGRLRAWLELEEGN